MRRWTGANRTWLLGLLCAVISVTEALPPSPAPTPAPAIVTEAEWKDHLKDAETIRVMMHTMEKQIYMIAANFNRTESAGGLATNIEALEQLLGGVKNSAPDPMIQTMAQSLEDTWTNQRKVLFTAAFTNADTTPITMAEALSLLGDEHQESFFQVAEQLITMQGALASKAQVSFSVPVISVALRQVGVIETMAAVVVAISDTDGASKATLMEKLQTRFAIYAEAQTGLLNGMTFLGLEATTSKCTLQRMGTVGDSWNFLRGMTSDILASSEVSEDARNSYAFQAVDLVRALEAANILYLDPVTLCAVTLSDAMWKNLIEVSSVQMMYALKVGRLFLQAAKRVNTLDSRVLLSDSLVGGGGTLNLIRSGSLVQQIPPPITQEVAALYAQLRSKWVTFEDLLASNVQTLSLTDQELIQSAEQQSAAFYEQAQAAMDIVEQQCISDASSVPCTVLRTIARQRVLLQKMAMESILQGVNQNSDINQKKMVNSSNEFESNHMALLQGDSRIPRTRDYCILQQLKDIQDKWIPFKALIDKVGFGDKSVATLLKIEQSQWAAGVDPMFATITKAVDSYRDGTGTCSQGALTREQYEVAILSVGQLRTLIEEVVKNYYLKVKGMTEDYDYVALKLQQHLISLLGGSSEINLPAPPSQTIANAIIAIQEGASNNGLTALQVYLDKGSQSDITQVANLNRGLDNRLATVMREYTDVAFANRDVNMLGWYTGERSNLASTQAMLVQKMAKQAVLLSFGNMAGTASDLLNSIADFNNNHGDLRDGNGMNGQDEIPKTTEEEHKTSLINISTDWLVLEPKLRTVADRGAAGTSDLLQIVAAANTLAITLEDALPLFATMTVTTTKIAVDLMIPLPMTGRWSPGKTMKIASEIARDIINQQQSLLPGYEVTASFFDDECDPDSANRKLLAQYASTTAWVGVGGMGCSDVCESLGVITASLFLPTVSFECSEGETLSDAALFPDFIRLGTRRNRLFEIFENLKGQISWWESVSIVSSTHVADAVAAQALSASMDAAGLMSTTVSAEEAEWDSTKAMMTEEKRMKHRILFFIGTESYLRRVVCAAGAVETPIGLTWLSEGVKSQSWWTLDDALLMADESNCNGAGVTDLYAGAVSIVGLGQAMGDDAGKPLDCFAGYTSATLRSHVMDQLSSGYPADHPNKTVVDNPHAELVSFALDGMCSLVMMVRHMLSQNVQIADQRTPSNSVFNQATLYLKDAMEFAGASGTVNIAGNDLPGFLALWQVQDGVLALAGYGGSASGAFDTTSLDLSKWLAAPPDPIVAMTAETWASVLDTANAQMMYTQKMGRLFLQAAQRVNTLDSRVLFSDSRVSARLRLQSLMNGDYRANIPAKWFTEEILNEYQSQLSVLNPYLNKLADYVATVDHEDVQLIADVENESALLFDMGTATMDLVEAQCLSRSTGDDRQKCTISRLLGRQRTLLQKMGKECALLGLGHEVEMNRAMMINTSMLYAATHTEVVHGNTAKGIPRTEDYCILQQMKAVHDDWLPFMANIQDIYDNGATPQTVLATDQAMWKAGVDPMYATISSVIGSYTSGSGTCTQVGDNQPTKFELEAALRMVGSLSELTQTVAKEYLFVVKGIPTDQTEHIAQFQDSLMHLVSGWTPNLVPAPTDQGVADALFAIEDGDDGLDNGWYTFKDLVQTAQSGRSDQAVNVGTMSQSLLTKAQDLMGRYVDSAWVMNQQVPGTRAEMMFGQLTLVQRMCKEATLISLNRVDNTQLNAAISLFGANHETLMLGNGKQGKRGIPPTTELSHLAAMAEVVTAWARFSGYVLVVARDGSATTGNLEIIAAESVGLRSRLVAAANLYGTETIITTKIPVNLMIPLPLTGRWSPGESMKVAASVALDIINEQQLLLPSYRLFAEFFDDECDADRANRAMLKQFASNTDWVGVGGMGCSTVCESLAVITASLFLPTMSFECSQGDALSSTALFPSFVRFGTYLSRDLDILTALKTGLEWWESVQFITSTFAQDFAIAESMQAALSQNDMANAMASADSDDWDSVKAMMADVKQAKARVIFFIGTEGFFRRTLCAGIVAQVPAGVLWMSEGIKSKGWWTLSDSALLAAQPECTVGSIITSYQYAISITGLGAPLEGSRDAPLECFDGHTSDTLYSHIIQQLENGYPSDHPNKTSVAAPHVELVNFAADGICSFALMVKHMLAQNHNIQTLRTPDQSIFDESTQFLKNTLAFEGASGHVKFTGNDLRGAIAIWQAVGNESILAGLTDHSGPISMTNLVTSEWSEAPPDPIVPMTSGNWINVIEQAGRLMMYAEKANRLFLQAAQEVNTLDSRVLFSDSRVGVRARLAMLLDGSARYDIPAKWFTEAIHLELQAMKNMWDPLEEMLAANVATVTTLDYTMIADAATSSMTIFNRGKAVLDLIVADCHARDSTVPCTALRVLGHQRTLLQHVSKLAALQGAGQDVEGNRALMVLGQEEFDQNHLDVVHGKAPRIAKTRDHCTLQQLKDVDDAWIPFKENLKLVFMGNLNTETILALDGAQWSAGVDPMFEAITKALNSYRDGSGECTQVLTEAEDKSVNREQYEAAIQTAGTLRELTQKVAKDYFFVVKGLTATLEATISDFTRILRRLISGWTPEKLPAPPTQAVVDGFFLVQEGAQGSANGWEQFQTLLAGAQQGQSSAVFSVASTSRALLEVVEAAMQEYVDAAWDNNRDVPGSRSYLASNLATLVQQMAKEAVLVSLAQSDARGQLASSIEVFERDRGVLLNGNQLAGKDMIVPTTEATHLAAMEDVGKEWTTFKDLVEQVAEEGYARDSTLENIALSSNNLVAECIKAAKLYSTMTRTTTKIPVNLMVLLPFSGRWAPGETMRVASMVAQDIINDQQVLLEGYRIISQFFDDGCDSDLANRAMLQQFASSQEWVGVGGMACSAVCESLSVITASLFLPTMSFECSAGAKLSDVSLFPNFVRLGTPRTRLLDIFEELKKVMPWWDELAILSGNQLQDTDRASELQVSMTARNLLSTASAADENNFENVKTVLRSLKQLKRRIIYFTGPEVFFRRVLCASKVVGTPPGVAWLSEGVKSRSWWESEDTLLKAMQPECTGSYISVVYQGAVSIAGLGSPKEGARNEGLDCFEGYNSDTVNAHVQQALTQGYPTDDSGAIPVDHPYIELINFALDGVCAFAKMIEHMLDQGNTIEELRTPNKGTYEIAVQYIRDTMSFEGASGRVKFAGNDLPGFNAIFQAIQGETVVAGLAGITGDVDTSSLSTAFWSEAPADPVVPMSHENWMNVIETQSVMMLFFEKAPRLFFQAAQRVNTLDSRVLFSNSIVQARARIGILLSGSVRENIPVKWFTATLQERYVAIQSQWAALEAELAENIGVVSLTDNYLLTHAASEARSLHEKAVAAMAELVTECRSRDAERIAESGGPSVPCEVLSVMGNQRVLLQKMSKEAALQGAGIFIPENRARMQTSLVEFDTAQYQLVHGHAPHIPRTTDYCILQQMKQVHDAWFPFKHDIQAVYEGNLSNARIFEIDTAQWKAGVDPMFVVVTDALQSYRSGVGKCTQVGEHQATRLELEAAIKQSGQLSELSQTVAKEYYFAVKGMPDKLSATLEQFAGALRTLISGWTPLMLPAPPTQDVANALFAVEDGDVGQNNGWGGYRAMLEQVEAGVSTDVSDVESNSQSILAKAEDAMAMYIDAAWNLNEDVPGTRASTSAGQLMLIQKMSKEAALVSLGRSDRGAQLLATINRFAQNHQILLAGNANDGKRAIPPTTEATHEQAMAKVWTKWVEFEETVKGIAESGYASTSTLETVALRASNLKTEMDVANSLYSTMTRTTTKETFDIMMPVPMTGSWSPGPTMRVAALVAQDIINQQQNLLPTYRLVMDFFDDECDPDKANRAMLKQFARSTAWMAMGGVGCSAVCETLTVISSSLFLPTMSFECSEGDTLSNQVQFPDFIRLGTRLAWKNSNSDGARGVTAALLMRLKSMISYWDVVDILGENSIEGEARATEAQAKLSAAGLAVSTTSTPKDFPALRGTMQVLKNNKRRIIFFVGDEDLLRRVVCASAAVDMLHGITWISEGVKGREWWTQDNTMLLEMFSSCTGSYITHYYQGALSVTGLGKPLDDASKPLTCFDGYTSQSLHQVVSQTLADGYEKEDGSTETAITYPHDELINFALDGVCAFALTIQHMLAQDGMTTDDLRTPGQDIYRQVVRFMKDTLTFTGASGNVKVTGNDLAGDIALWQVVGDENIVAGYAFKNESIDLFNVKSDLWRDARKDAIIPMEVDNWMAVLDAASVQATACQKAPRLFFQAAREVNTLDSRVLFSDSRVGSRGRLLELMDGSARNNIPAKWFTVSVKEQYDTIWSEWIALEDTLADNIQTVKAQDVVMIKTVAAEASSLYAKYLTVIHDIEQECITRTAQDNIVLDCTGINIVAHQRVLLQRMSQLTVLMGLGEPQWRAEAIMLVSEFDAAQDLLVHGRRSANIALRRSRTSEYCTLQELQVVQDLWLPFQDKMNDALYGQNIPSNDLLFSIDTSQWKAGVDPMFFAITAVRDAFETGAGVCTQVGDNNATRENLEAAIATLTNFCTLSQRLVMERFARDQKLTMNMTLVSIANDAVKHLISGWSRSELPAPPSQAVANSLFAIQEQVNGWFALSDELDTVDRVYRSSGGADLDEVSAKRLHEASLSTGEYCQSAVDEYVLAAWDINQDVPGSRSARTGKLNYIVQQILMEKASEKYMKSRQKYIGLLMAEWEANYNILLGGSVSRRLNSATAVKATTEGEHKSALENMRAQFVLFKSAINNAGYKDGGVDMDALQNVTSYASVVAEQGEATNELFSIMVQTTTKTPIHIMLPLPMTGVWAPGDTMKMATEIAQDIINTQQVLMPGYRFIADFFDDQCDPDRAMRDMLEKFAASQDWVGVGGLGCASVCESLAVISASLFLPLVSFECSDGTELSNGLLFPEFVRLGTTRHGLAAVMQSLSTVKTWFSTLRIVAGDSYGELMIDVAAQLNNWKAADESPFSLSINQDQMDDQFSTVQGIMANVMSSKDRLILLLGSESHLRLAVCASSLAGNAIGLTWVIDGVRAKNWWLEYDQAMATAVTDYGDVTDYNTICGAPLSNLLQGSVSVMGLGRPLHGSMLDQSIPAPVEEDLECFQGYTASSLNQVVRDELARGPSAPDGPEPNRTAVEHPHLELISFALDGMCIFAKTLREFVVRRQNSIQAMRERDQNRFNQITGYIKESLSFEGASGTVKIQGNDLPGSLGIWQLQGNESKLVGIYGTDGVLNFSWATGLNNESWEPAPEDQAVVEEESFPVLAVVIPILGCFFCAIVCYAVYSGRGAVSKSSNNKG